MRKCTRTENIALDTGHRYMAYNDIMWALETHDKHPVRTQYPCAAMVYPPGTNGLDRANGHAGWEVMFEDHKDKQTMDYTLINRLYDMLWPYAMDIKDDARDLGNPTFLLRSKSPSNG